MLERHILTNGAFDWIFLQSNEYETLVKRYISTIFLRILALVVSIKVIFLAAIN